uniref:Uncharacterized protein n=1 Tax=Fundulus heteroclitus TaxID=8078 RepID=A0A3Q2QJ00_FUNHE
MLVDQQADEMSEEENSELGKKFFVVLSGERNKAHQSIVKKLTDYGQTEILSLEECDYLLVFCPIVSRVGTDIQEALSKIPDLKKAILVVMHPAFDPNQTIADSRRHVEKPNILVTVDCLFYEGDLLRCDRNNKAMADIERVLSKSCVTAAGWRNLPNRVLKLFRAFSAFIVSRMWRLWTLMTRSNPPPSPSPPS